MEALERLQSLIGQSDPVTGRATLRVILDLHRCQDNVPKARDKGLPGGNERFPGWNPAACDDYARQLGSVNRWPNNPLGDPRHYVQADVISVEADPRREGAVIARTATGDMVTGAADAVLSRLLEASGADRL